jgi:hypothetical protein
LWTIIPHSNPEDVLLGIREFHSGGGVKGSLLLKIGDNGVVGPLYPPDVESSTEEIYNQKNNDGEKELARFGHGDVTMQFPLRIIDEAMKDCFLLNT